MKLSFSARSPRRVVELVAAVGLTLAAATSLSPLSAQEYKAGSLKIEKPWTRATPTGARVAGGFMRITNTGKEADRLVGGASPVAGRFEVHEMRMEGEVMRMRELANGLVIQPGQTVELKPGSYHVMFMDMKAQLKQGEKVKGTLQFEKAGTVEVEYSVEGMALRAPSHGSGMHHK
jgi:copper(I)-binding protein